MYAFPPFGIMLKDSESQNLKSEDNSNSSSLAMVCCSTETVHSNTLKASREEQPADPGGFMPPSGELSFTDSLAPDAVNEQRVVGKSNRHDLGQQE